MFRLAHISDIHLGPLPPMRRRELASKRITGYANWRMNRNSPASREVLFRLLSDLAERNPDHLAITGDLINLGHHQEMLNARDWLARLADPRDVSLVCGNHDAYVPGALSLALSCWGQWTCGDDRAPPASEAEYPVVRRRDNISLILCNSARASLPFLATGYFRSGQASRLRDILEAEGAQGRCRMVLIHHPPVRGAAAFHKRLIGAGLMRRVLRQAGAELVLHGHTHRDSVHFIEGPDGRKVPVVGVPAAGQAPGGHRPAGRYNLFTIMPGPRGWSVAMQEYGITALTEPVGLIAKRQLISPFS
jgi:3',5'-cyclic AMP phosphodiesterase CpdA